MTTPPPTPPEPTYWPLVAALTHCLCANLVNTIGGPPGRCCALPGSAVVLDDCCDGTAWVRMERVDTIPAGTSSIDRPASSWGGQPCGPNLVRIVLGIGVMRCAAGLDEAGVPPTCERLEWEMQRWLSDMDAIYRTAACCEADVDVFAVDPLVMAPLGPAGGCVGGELTVAYTVDLCPCGIDNPGGP